MWKILVAFIIFAAVALTLVFNMGDKIDMQGESAGHETSAENKEPAAAPATPAAPAAADAEKK